MTEKRKKNQTPYGKILRRTWRAAEFRPLPRDIQVTYCYLRSQPDCRNGAIFYLSLAQAAHDLKTDCATMSEWLTVLSRQAFIQYDASASLVYLAGWDDDDPPENPNVMVAWIRIALDLPRSPLHGQFADDIGTFLETQSAKWQDDTRFCDLLDKLRARGEVEADENHILGDRLNLFGNPSVNPSGNPLANPSANPSERVGERVSGDSDAKNINGNNRNELNPSGNPSVNPSETLPEGLGKPFGKGLGNPEPEPEPFINESAEADSTGDQEGEKEPLTDERRAELERRERVGAIVKFFIPETKPPRLTGEEAQVRSLAGSIEKLYRHRGQPMLPAELVWICEREFGDLTEVNQLARFVTQLKKIDNAEHVYSLAKEARNVVDREVLNADHHA